MNNNVAGPQDVLDFWFKTLTPADWYVGGPEIDAEITRRFAPAWNHAMAGRLDHWRTSPEGVLAHILLTDQMPRNMFRGEAMAFASDAIARRAAFLAIKKQVFLKIDEPARQFFFLPLMHSESAADQDASVCMFLIHMSAAAADNLLHARAHREVIRRFGRFPTRNLALGRRSTQAEQAYLAAGGYGAIVQELRG